MPGVCVPEIAEVETVRRVLDHELRGQTIREVIADESDRFLFTSDSPRAAVVRALEGARVTGTGRKGKYLWIELNRKPWLLIHLGMTGQITITSRGKKNRRHPKMWEGVKFLSDDRQSDGQHLRFCRILLRLKNNTEIGLIDPRRFARVRLIDDPATDVRLRKLGMDPLADFPAAKELFQILKKRKISIKTLLLDQKVFAGVGNWLADEILFQSKLSPHHLASDLSATDISRLRSKTLAVIHEAVDCRASYELFPKSWLFHHRWGKNKNAKTSKGQKIVHEEFGGRTTAWVPSVQK